MSTFTFTPETIVPALNDLLDAGLVPFIKGSPGTAKSAMGRRLAAMRRLKLLDVRLAQCDPTDLNGFPARSLDGLRMEWLPAALLPLEGDPIPDGYDGWMLFLDEANAAPAAVQAAAYKLTLDRTVGQRKLHEKCSIILAGNLDTDRAVTHRMSTALKSRLVHMQLDVNHDVFDRFILEEDWDERIIAFLRFRPDLTFKFDPSSAEDTFACLRTWEFVNKYLHTIGARAPQVEVLAGMVGDGTAVEFTAFLEQMLKCPTLEEILLAPDTTAVPQEPSMLYAVATMLGRKLDEKNIVGAVIYLDRIGVEFQILAMRTAMAARPAIKLTPTFKQWAIARKDDLFGR